MTKLEQLIEQLCPDGVEYKSIGSFAACTPGATPSTSKKEYWENGTIPWMSSGEVNLGEVVQTEKYITQLGYDNSSTKMIPADTVVIALAGQGKTRGKVAITRIPLCTNQSLCAIITDDSVLSRYLLHFLRSQYLKLRDISSGDGTRGGLNVKMIKAYQIPVPPIEVQAEIVRILDTFTELTTKLTTELTTELTNRKKQYEYYRDRLLTFGEDVKWKTLGDIGKVSMCKRIMKNETSSDGEVPFYKIGTFGKEPDAFISFETFEKYRKSYSYPNKGDILISAAGTIGRTVVFDGEPSYFQDSNIVWISNDETKVTNRFLYYWYQTNPWKASTGGTIARLYNDNISKAKVPVLPIEEQNRVVTFLDRFDKLCNDISEGLPAEIEARQKQYEYYRDKLLTFKEM